MEPQVFRWEELGHDSPIPLLTRKRVIGERMMISLVELKKGCQVLTHSHENEQFAYVVRGAALFGLGEEGSQLRREVRVGAGEVLHLPSGVPHSCDALEDTTIVDLFSPISAGTGIDSQAHG